MNPQSKHPFSAMKCSGIWHVIDANNTPVLACDCRFTANEMAKEMNEHATMERARHCGLAPDYALIPSELA